MRDWNQQPAVIYPPYKSTVTRNPKKPLIPVPENLIPTAGPVYGHEVVDELDNDLTMNARVNGEPIGERIHIHGKVTDDRGQPIRNTLIEIWQANSAGRYVHKSEVHDAPLDPNFLGAGRTLTNNDGSYMFTTIRPASYPWGNHHNAWRPAHIHFSILGREFTQRLITQMYFEGDPLLKMDPIFDTLPNDDLKNRLISKFSTDLTVPGFAHAYVFNITINGRYATPFEENH